MFPFERRAVHSREGRERARKLFLIRSIVTLVLFGCLFIASLWLSYLPELRVGPLSLAGSSALGEDALRFYVEKEIGEKYFGLFPKTNIALYPRRALEEGLLDSFPNLLSASVSLGEDYVLEVVVLERDPAYLWCTEAEPSRTEEIEKTVPEKAISRAEELPVSGNGTCYFLDAEGVIFGKAPQFSPNVYFELWGTPEGERERSGNKKEFPEGFYLLSHGKWSQLIALKDNLNGLGIEAIRGNIREEGDREFILENGVKIFWNSSEGIDMLLQNLNSALDALVLKKDYLIKKYSPLEYLDLRFGKKVFYKFK